MRRAAQVFVVLVALLAAFVVSAKPSEAAYTTTACDRMSRATVCLNVRVYEFGGKVRAAKVMVSQSRWGYSRIHNVRLRFGSYWPAYGWSLTPGVWYTLNRYPYQWDGLSWSASFMAYPSSGGWSEYGYVRGWA